jgi:hypothetical protein
VKQHGHSREHQGLWYDPEMGGLTGDKLESDCGRSLLPLESLGFFLVYSGTTGGIEQGSYVEIFVYSHSDFRV